MAKKKRTAGAVAQAASSSTKGKPVDFREEYTYVLGDLKRIGVLAAGLFALLIILSFII